MILRAKSLGLGEVEAFPFVDPPNPRAIADGYDLLAELGAVDEAKSLTSVGQELARLPLDPRVARMLVAAREEGCLAQVRIIAAALSVQDPRSGRWNARRRPTSATRASPTSSRTSSPFSSCGSCRRNPGCGASAVTIFSPIRACANGATCTSSSSRRSTGPSRRVRAEKPEGYRAIHRALLAGTARQCRHARRRGRLHRRARHQVLGASRLVDEEAGQVDRRRGAGGDHAALRALGRRHRAALAGGARVASPEAQPQRPALGEGARRGGGARARQRSTACRCMRIGACRSRRTIRILRATSSSARRWSKAISTRARPSSRTTGAWLPRSSASSTSRAGRTSWWTTS